MFLSARQDFLQEHVLPRRLIRSLESISVYGQFLLDVHHDARCAEFSGVASQNEQLKRLSTVVFSV